MIDGNMMHGRSAMFVTFGCKLNFSETATVERMMADRGIVRTPAGGVPDIIFVNSCSVTAEADKKCRQKVRSLAKRYPGAAIILSGCYAQLKPDEAAALPGVAIVAGNDRKDLIMDYLDRWMTDGLAATQVTPEKEMRRFVPSCSRGDRTRYFLKVQDGCDYFCSYCTIPMARGRSRSATIPELVEQARQVAREGGREIVLTGVNIGDFGKGREDSFFDLIRELDGVEGIERYRISSIEPNLLTPEIIEFVAGSRSFMPHFHIPLQSGDDEVLRLMRRRYDTALFADRIATVRRLIPHAFIGIDLIVGARGETAERFARSCEFVKGLDVNHLHVFPYSERPGTRALDIDAIVPGEERHERSRLMNAISATMHRAFAERSLGSVRPVLVEGRAGRGGRYAGFTDNYIRVSLEAPVAAVNTIVNVRLDALSDDPNIDVNGVIVP